ncbi:MAG: hypothetical protein CVU87_12065 [Firmicutes bacterium HGW-Firmicutes-12]|nr:MAG: hypothetical protein CVU87_12065 [Firmicutes bacterium HGW-Firmicutes-12]
MIECIITSSVLIVVIIFLRFLFRGKISRRLQYALWGLVLLRLLIPFSLFESSLSIMNAVPYNSFSERQVYVLPISKQPVNRTSGLVINSTDTAVDTNSFGYVVLSEDGTTITRYAEKMNIGKILSLIWLLGSIAVGMWFIGINFRFYKRLRKTRQAYQSINCKLPIYITEHIASPCLFGILYPAIYMTPKAVESESSSGHVITHELCHYRHGDHIWSILRGLCLAGWWWNPLVWAAAIFSREDSELACDEAVIKKIGVENRFSYGHTFVDMIAIRKSPTDLMCAATTMISGKRSLKERLNMIIKNPKTVIPAMISVLLIVAVCVGCTFTSASKDTKEQDLPAVDMVFSSDNYNDLEKLGRDAATFYYSQFMEGTIPQYWHITKHETLSCQLIAGNEKEFAVWVTSYIETNGAGFLVGQGIPHDPDDITKGGICPDVGKQLRIKALGDGKYEIVSIGTGGGTQGLIPVEKSVTYGLSQLSNGEVLHTISPLSGNDTQLAEDAVMSVDRTNLEACFSEAILATNKDHYHNGDFATEAHSFLKTIEKDNITTVYAMALFVEFGYAGGGFSETGSSHMPVAISMKTRLIHKNISLRINRLAMNRQYNTVTFM